MTDKEFQILLTKCADLAGQHLEAGTEVQAECKRRYGVAYSDVDADGIIDVLDYYGGTMTLSEFEKEMASNGAVRIDKK